MLKLLLIILLLAVIGASAYYVLGANHNFSNIWTQGNHTTPKSGTMVEY